MALSVSSAPRNEFNDMTVPYLIDEVDIIISNPPYVVESQKKNMKVNVLNFEPEKSIFVSDENPLIFYKRIFDISKLKLKEGGLLYFEINEM